MILKTCLIPRYYKINKKNITYTYAVYIAARRCACLCIDFFQINMVIVHFHEPYTHKISWRSVNNFS